ncbi:MAG: VacB/RNase II family 3'-5' exoribonuclease [Lentisphaeria bacterium]|nr:VacB/RNase II family 3'-5' exoribonuclease [Lentisphaeria bacterium]
MAKSKKQSRQSRAPRRVLYSGVFSAAAAGFGFVKVPGDPTLEFFIPRKYTGHALDGDTVEVEQIPDERDATYSKRKSGPVGRIVSVTGRNREFVVGCLDSLHEIRPLDKHLPETIRVNSAPRNAKKGDWVQVRLLDDGANHTEQLRGHVERSLGSAGDVAHDLNAIAAEFGLPPAYTAEDEAEALKIAPLEIEREDLSSLYTLTIDPADAHDFDDAISVQPAAKAGEITLGVHIADVATWIRPGSKFDKAAAYRSFSSYLPGKFLPMLPKPLTAKISLREKVLSPAHSVIFTVRLRDGKILSSRRVHSLVKVNRRMDYDTVQAFLNDPAKRPKGWTKQDAENVQLLHKLVKKMRGWRAKHEQFLWIDVPEIRVLCDESTHEIKGLLRRIPCAADGIVEECMLAANSAVANELIERGVGGLFRIHPEPDPEKLAEFEGFVSEAFGVSTGDLSSGRAACMHFLENIPDDHRKPVILSRFLRSMARASYSENPELHFGLGKTRYSHFTSPIRRYPDLALHQQLLALDLNKRLRSKRMLAEIAVLCSKKEERNDNAFYAANDRLKLHFLKNSGALENTTMYEAIIQKVTSSGLMCEIPELGMLGFVPTSRFRAPVTRRNSRYSSRMESGHTGYRPGDFIYIALDSIDLVRGHAQFRPVI